MDGRNRMTLSGSDSYYLNLNREGTSGSGSGDSEFQTGNFIQPSYNPFSKSSISVQSNIEGRVLMDSTFEVKNQSQNLSYGINEVENQSQNLSYGINEVENQSQNLSYGINESVPSSLSPGDQLKKKRGRPRKDGPNGAKMSLGLTHMPSTPFPGTSTPACSTKTRGRPRGSGWKQRLAPLGEWMNNTAGQAFTPHVLHVGIGEDVAEKILSFAQQRPRALCVMSAKGVVSLVTLCQGTSEGTITYEGCFDIVCLSGSYLVSETGGPRDRDGGLSISLSSPGNHCIGGAIGGRLIASCPVQVAVCSFIYGSKAMGNTPT